MLGVQAAFVASHEKGRLKWWLPGMAGTLFNEYASFVQALRLDFCSIDSGSLIWFTRSLLPYTSLWVTRNGTQKCLRKKLKPNGLLDEWLKWETENTHLGEKKISLQLCPFLSSLVCTEKKTLLYLFVKDRQCIRLFWSVHLFEPGILWDVIHKCFAAHHFLGIVCILWLWLWGETVRMGSLLWLCQGRTRPLWKEPQAKFIPVHVELVCLFYFAKKFFPPTSFLALRLQGCRCAGEVYFSSPHMYKHTLACTLLFSFSCYARV